MRDQVGINYQIFALAPNRTSLSIGSGFCRSELDLVPESQKLIGVGCQDRLTKSRIWWILSVRRAELVGDIDAPIMERGGSGLYQYLFLWKSSNAATCSRPLFHYARNN